MWLLNFSSIVALLYSCLRAIGMLLCIEKFESAVESTECAMEVPSSTKLLCDLLPAFWYWKDGDDIFSIFGQDGLADCDDDVTDELWATMWNTSVTCSWRRSPNTAGYGPTWVQGRAPFYATCTSSPTLELVGRAVRGTFRAQRTQHGGRLTRPIPSTQS